MTRMRDKKAFPPSSVASCVWSTDAVRVCTRWCVRLYWGPETEVGGECVLVYVCIQTDLILTVSAHWPLSGRQIFEDFRALRAQANFDSNFGKSVFTPSRRAGRVGETGLYCSDDRIAISQLQPAHMPARFLGGGQSAAKNAVHPCGTEDR